MRVIHSPASLRYKKPFGACPQSSEVFLAIDIIGHEGKIASVSLCYVYGYQDFVENYLLMEKVQEQSQTQPERYEVSFTTQDEVGLFFYYFKIDFQGGGTLYALATENLKEARISYDFPNFETDPPYQGAFRMPIYLKDWDTPNWAKGAVMYQIFPDRFARSQDFSFQKMIEARPASERIYHKSWREDVDIYGKFETGYLACDFFGGNLKGITESLEHIAKLGVSIIYLNPICAARSNHRYDTSDYKTVDPILGTNEDFQTLCEQAKKLGIYIIIDAVFSHTGADSKYFNRQGRFNEIGAWQSAVNSQVSPYASWYNFYQEEGELKYDSWWGFPDLPSVNELDLGFRSYILGKNGVIEHWMNLGAKGFRLDVSDELPDTFLRALYKKVKSIDPDALVMGEVWENPTVKVSYGSYRDFAWGRTHDSVMGYPFASAVLSFLKGDIPAETFADELNRLKEDYPKPFFETAQTLLSSHDIPRFITSVAASSNPESREVQAYTYLNPEERKNGERLLLMAAAIQFAYPGIPSIYYGDELAMEGYRDPFNRRTYDWANLEAKQKIFNDFASLGTLRKRHEILRLGEYQSVFAENDLFVFSRTLKNEKMFCMVNRSQDLISYKLNDKIYKIPARSVVWLMETGEFLAFPS